MAGRPLPAAVPALVWALPAAQSSPGAHSQPGDSQRHLPGGGWPLPGGEPPTLSCSSGWYIESVWRPF